MSKYEAQVIRVGGLAADLVDTGNMIIFDDTENEALAEVCFLHTRAELAAAPEVGDAVLLGRQRFTIAAVGEEAPKTLRELGHCTFCFSEAGEAELPGQINLAGAQPLAPLDVGDKIVIG